jgi:hypothetical protein
LVDDLEKIIDVDLEVSGDICWALIVTVDGEIKKAIALLTSSAADLENDSLASDNGNVD